MKFETKDRLSIKGKININTYRAGMVALVTPYLEQIRLYKKLLTNEGSEIYRRHLLERIDRNIAIVASIKHAAFIRTAVACPNLIMDSPGYGLDIIIQRLVGMNTYSLNITHGEMGTGATAPALSDIALTTPTNRAAVGFQQDYGQTDAIVQFFFSDSQLANQTYKEFGTFIDGSSSIGTGQIFNHALLSPVYEKAAGTDTTVQVDISIANS